MSRIINMIDRRFDKVVVIERIENSTTGQLKYLCRCDCGETVVKFGNNLRRQLNQSCKKCSSPKGKPKIKQVQHGLSKHPLYQPYQSMIVRAETPGYEHVKICDRWREPDGQGLRNYIIDKYASWRPGLTFDRTDGKGDYTPDNTRWATTGEQQRNKSTNRCLEHDDGRQMIMADWATELGIRNHTFHYQFNTGKHPQLTEIPYDQRIEGIS